MQAEECVESAEHTTEYTQPDDHIHPNADMHNCVNIVPAYRIRLAVEGNALFICVAGLANRFLLDAD